MSPVWIDAQGKVHGLDQFVVDTAEPEPEAPISPDSSFTDTGTLNETVSELPASVTYNNGLEMTDVEFQIAKQEARESGENPSYEEFRLIIKSLNSKEKHQLQEVVGARIDGVP